MLETRLNAMGSLKEQASKTAIKLTEWSDTLVKKQLELQRLEQRLNDLDVAIVTKQAQENEVTTFLTSLSVKSCCGFRNVLCNVFCL